MQENCYDVENMRFELLENGKRTCFVYHDGELLHEEGGKENRQTGYHLGAGIEAFSRGQETYYYQQDEQLSTAFITGRNGKIHNSYQYDAFGNELETAGQLSNRIRYTGQQYDDLTGQYYLRARYYNPVLGRFMQEDTYQGDGLNLYAYCKNNPVTYYDPSGYEDINIKNNSNCPIPRNGGDGGDNPISDESKETWGKGSFPSVEESLVFHMEKHGDSVDAIDIDQYVRKAVGFSQNLKGAKKAYLEDGTPGAVRFEKSENIL